MSDFTTEELTQIARAVDPGSPEIVERDGLRFTFGQEHDDQGVIAYVNDMDALGKLGWPEPASRWDPHGQQRRPDGFTGAARLFGATPMHDAIWWEPYREGRKVYDSPEDVRFMRELLDWGVIGVTLTVERRESCGHWHECAHESLWGIESPLCHPGDEGYEYLASVYDDLISQAIDQLEAA
jgi:hypothetical protein